MEREKESGFGVVGMAFKTPTHHMHLKRRRKRRRRRRIRRGYDKVEVGVG